MGVRFLALFLLLQVGSYPSIRLKYDVSYLISFSDGNEKGQGELSRLASSSTASDLKDA